MNTFKFAAQTIAVARKQVVSLSLSLIACVALLSLEVKAAELSVDKPIRLLGSEIDAIMNVQKKEIRINRFSIDKVLPTGEMKHTLPKPYVLRLLSFQSFQPKKRSVFTASDWYDGIGLKLKIEIYVTESGRGIGTINITSQHEETTLFYSAQQLKVEQN
jgi:hypothetical protein